MVGQTLLVAEVKSRVVPRNTPNLQLLAELRMLQLRDPKTGIVGLLVNPQRAYLYLPERKGRKFGQVYTVKSRT